MFAFVLAFAFILLLVSFRSIVIPLKAITLNLLSVGAAYGVLVAIFQYGWGEHILDFRSSGGDRAWLPIFMFVILFGLSMDYHVFILSRVREADDRGMKTEAPSSRDQGHGRRRHQRGDRDGGCVPDLRHPADHRHEGNGRRSGLAVLIDATIVRVVLLPATMKLLGDWNWYLPRWLNWLRLERAGEPEGKPVPPTPPRTRDRPNLKRRRAARPAPFLARAAGLSSKIVSPTVAATPPDEPRTSSSVCSASDEPRPRRVVPGQGRPRHRDLYGAARFGQQLAYLHGTVGAIWPPVGIGIALLVIGGPWLWPGIFLGDILPTDWSAPLGSILGQTTGNVLEVLVAALLFMRLAGRRTDLSASGASSHSSQPQPSAR